MIYLEETFNLLPAHPENLDAFISMAKEKLIPVCERLGTRVVAAWTTNVEWFSQVTQVMEFKDVKALKKFRIDTSKDIGWGEYAAQLEEFAPERRSRLLEPWGGSSDPAVPPEDLQKAIEESKKSPVKVYGIATLEVNPNKMPQFLEGFKVKSPIRDLIIACWRPIGGRPNQIIDLWKTYSPPKGYQPADELSKQFFGPLRENAPKEHYRGVSMLPYSELQ
ncbi:MAG: hypothetical protein ACXABO_04085 [Promethearchaeota archaeon]